VTITAIDSDGAETITTFELIVENVAPQFEVVGNDADSFEKRSEPDSTVQLFGSFSDPGIFDTHEVIVDWNDGSELESVLVDQFNNAFAGEHAYEQGGIYEVSITLIDDDGGMDTAVTTVFVTGHRLTDDGVLHVITSNGKDDVHVKLKKDKGKKGEPDREYLEIDLKMADDDSKSKKSKDSKIVIELDDVILVIAYLGDGDDHFHFDKDLLIDTEVYGGAGKDHLKGGAGVDRFFGEEGNDKIEGGEGSDELFGGEGDDKISGNDGDDLLDGGSGNDDLDGDKGDDMLIGGEGDDKISGKDGNDILIGASGDDDLNGGKDDDQAWYLGFESDYTVTGKKDKWEIEDKAGIEVKDKLSDVEEILFDYLNL
jgi:Ca2+-binding RTX toxin-like protein